VHRHQLGHHALQRFSKISIVESPAAAIGWLFFKCKQKLAGV
jgi:hypothetical protein